MLPIHKYGESGKIAIEEFTKIMKGETSNYNLFVKIPYNKIDYCKTTNEIIEYILKNTGYEKHNVFSDNINGTFNSFIIEKRNEGQTYLISCLTSYNHEMEGCTIEIQVQKPC